MTTNDPEEYDGYSVDDEDQLDPADTLIDGDLADELDRGYSPPEGYSAAQRYGNTPWEAAHDRPLSDRLAEEQPDLTPIEDGPASSEEDDLEREAGNERAGRLVDPDEGLREDAEAALVASDVGIDSAAASAEEAAMHVLDDSAPDDDPDGRSGI